MFTHKFVQRVLGNKKRHPLQRCTENTQTKVMW